MTKVERTNCLIKYLNRKLEIIAKEEISSPELSKSEKQFMYVHGILRRYNKQSANTFEEKYSVDDYWSSRRI